METIRKQNEGYSKMNRELKEIQKKRKRLLQDLRKLDREEHKVHDRYIKSSKTKYSDGSVHYRPKSTTGMNIIPSPADIHMKHDMPYFFITD